LPGEDVAVDLFQAVVDEHRQARREALGLLPPVADDGHVADQQHRAALAGLAVALELGQCLDGLAQAHVVGQAGPQAPVAREGQRTSKKELFK
jgi:hypothetical protein